MSKRARVTPEIIQRVKEINDNHPGLCRWEIGKQVGVSDATVKRILNDEYEIAGDVAVRIYRHTKKGTDDTDLEQNMLNMYPNTNSTTKQLLNTLYGSNQVTLKDIYDELKQIREALTDMRNMLKYSFKG